MYWTEEILTSNQVVNLVERDREPTEEHPTMTPSQRKINCFSALVSFLGFYAED